MGKGSTLHKSWPTSTNQPLQGLCWRNCMAQTSFTYLLQGCGLPLGRTQWSKMPALGVCTLWQTHWQRYSPQRHQQMSVARGLGQMRRSSFHSLSAPWASLRLCWSLDKSKCTKQFGHFDRKLEVVGCWQQYFLWQTLGNSLMGFERELQQYTRGHYYS